MRTRPGVILTVLALAALISACGGTDPGASGATASIASQPAPSVATAVPTYTFSALNATYEVSTKHATNSCHTPGSGPWSYLYTGVEPFMTMDLTVYPGAGASAPSSDFDLYFEFADGQAYQLTPSGRREEKAGDGTAKVTPGDDGATIEVMGSAEGRADAAGKRTDVDLVLTCPG